MRIGILGSGNWGCGLTYLFSAKHEVILWGRNPEKIQSLRFSSPLAKIAKSSKNSIRFTSDLDSAISSVDLIIESVSIQGIRELLQTLKKSKLKTPLIFTSKGFERETDCFPSQIAREYLDCSEPNRISILTGPTLAKEIMDEKPAFAVMACKDLGYAESLSRELSVPNFKVLATTDVIGVQFGGAFKNILAIASGCSDGLNLGSNAKAFVLTRGLQEIRHIALAIGCMPHTIYGLSGLGDMLATCFSHESRNYKLGWHIARNENLDEAKKIAGRTLEGIDSCRSLLNVARKLKLSAPICEIIYDMLMGKEPAKRVVDQIMNTQEILEWT